MGMAVSRCKFGENAALSNPLIQPGKLAWFHPLYFRSSGWLREKHTERQIFRCAGLGKNPLVAALTSADDRP